MIAGRDFNERDRGEADPEVIVSATLARQVFEGQSPLGRAGRQRLRYPSRFCWGAGRSWRRLARPADSRLRWRLAV
jgi:hypothetical protein